MSLRLYRFTTKVLLPRVKVAEVTASKCSRALFFAGYLVARKCTCVRIKPVFGPTWIALTGYSLCGEFYEISTSSLDSLSLFLDLEAVFGSVDHAVFRHSLLMKDVAEKFTVLVQILYADNQNGIRDYDDLSSGFTMRSGVRHGCCLPLFLLHVLIEMIMETALSLCEVSGICTG